MSASFESFWQAYPRKEGRAACLKKWEQKKLDGQAALIVAHVTKRAKDDKKWRDGFIPMPLTFLNQERWTDEYETIKPKEQQGRKVSDFIPPAFHPQPDPYKACLNLAVLKILMHVRGTSTEKLRAVLKARNEIVQEWREMWRDEVNNDELRDLSDGYLNKLKGALK